MTNITIIAAKAAYPGNLADEYLHLKAQMADLKKAEDALKDAILATGKASIEGNFGRVVVSEIVQRVTIDYKRAAETMIAPKVLADFTRVLPGNYRFNVKARIGEKAA